METFQGLWGGRNHMSRRSWPRLLRASYRLIRRGHGQEPSHVELGGVQELGGDDPGPDLQQPLKAGAGTVVLDLSLQHLNSPAGSARLSQLTSL